MSAQLGPLPDVPPLHAAEVRWVARTEVDGLVYQRAVVRTPWLAAGDDVAAVVRTQVGALLRDGDVVVVSEKAVVIAAGLGVPVETVVVSRLARWLAAWVRPTDGSRGLSIPEKMAYVAREAGLPRVLAATLAAGMTRPFGVRGAFYLVAGRTARATDGMRPPFEGLLLPSLPPQVALRMARGFAAKVGVPVAIVDMNDRGGSIRAVSHRVISKRRLRRVLADNPLGQRDTRTPVGIVRPGRLALAVG